MWTSPHVSHFNLKVSLRFTGLLAQQNLGGLPQASKEGLLFIGSSWTHVMAVFTPPQLSTPSPSFQHSLYGFKAQLSAIPSGSSPSSLAHPSVS